MGRKHRSRNRRILACAFCSPGGEGVLPDSFKVVMSRSVKSTEAVFQERLYDIMESLLEAVLQLNVG